MPDVSAADASAPSQRYRLWLKLRVGKRLDAQEELLTALVAGRTVTIKSDSSESLSNASWLVLECRGFETEHEARQFGEKLRLAVHVAGLSARVGVDARDPDDDHTTSWVNPDVLKSTERDLVSVPDVHGIAILPDDESSEFVSMQFSAGVQVGANPDDFVCALEQASIETDDQSSETNRRAPIRRAIRALSLAETNNDSIAKIVLAVSSVEGVAAGARWGTKHRKLIESTAQLLADADDSEEARDVVEAIKKLASARRKSHMQSVKHLLSQIGLCCKWNEWQELYDKRSRLFHGDSTAGEDERLDSYVTEPELHQLGENAVRLCGLIVLTTAKREGISVPDCASVHFGVE